MFELWRLDGLQLISRNDSQHAAVRTAGRISELDGQQSNGMSAARTDHGQIGFRTPADGRLT